MPGYYTNESNMNLTNGIFVFILYALMENTALKMHGKLKTTSIIINLNNKWKLKISGLYR